MRNFIKFTYASANIIFMEAFSLLCFELGCNKTPFKFCSVGSIAQKICPHAHKKPLSYQTIKLKRAVLLQPFRRCTQHQRKVLILFIIYQNRYLTYITTTVITINNTLLIFIFYCRKYARITVSECTK